MPKVDFSLIDDVQDYTPLPDGKYLCELVHVEEAKTQYDDEMWKLKFRVMKGEHEGRFVFDNLVFSKAAEKRLKLICSRLGLDVSGELDLTTETIKGRTCFITVATEDYKDENDKSKKRNVVPFAGYDHADQAESKATKTNEDEDLF